jgi:hypothetical protein
LEHEGRDRSDQLRHRPEEGGRERSHHQRELGFDAESRALEDVIRKAYENDILFVAAAAIRVEQRSHAALSVELQRAERDQRAALDRTISLRRFRITVRRVWRLRRRALIF